MVAENLVTPVALFVFNRPAHTKRVFEEIKKARPEKLLIVSDGARRDVSGEAALVSECREIVSQVDWQCEVLRDFAEQNLGCRTRLSSGLDWIFSQVNEAIILEDDCLPTSSFFIFMSELLQRYRDDPRVGSISGFNPIPTPINEGDQSYFFSAYPSVWGWATWRRVWKDYDVNISEWPSLDRAGVLERTLISGRAVAFWRRSLTNVYKKEIDTWDYQLTLLHLKNSLLSIAPGVNLVTNTGFGQGATHTLNSSDALADFPASEIAFPLVHPIEVERSSSRDVGVERVLFEKSWLKVMAHIVFDSMSPALKTTIKKMFTWMKG
jgi:hypothetical protein